MALTQTHARTSPTLGDTLTYFKQGNLVPVTRRLLADLDTPVSIYLKLRTAGLAAFLLESVEGGEQVSRYSFIGIEPRARILSRGGQVSRIEGDHIEALSLDENEDPLDALRRELSQSRPVQLDGLPHFTGGAVGMIAYDMVRHFERLPDTSRDDLDLPEMLFLLVDTLVIFDHAQQQVILLSNARDEGDQTAAYLQAIAHLDRIEDALTQGLQIPSSSPAPASPAMSSNISREAFEENVRQAKEHIAAGDAFQVVLSQRFSRPTQADPLQIYRALRALNPSPYMFFFEFGLLEPGKPPLALIGASPEMMVRLEEGIGTLRPIAGTRHRGANPAEDARLEADLLADPKERAEHVMLVDLGRNDIGRVSEYGSVQVPQMMVVEKYSHVMHIVSQVEGRIRPNLDAFDLLRATFPAGTLSGAPKVRAMGIIEALEGVKRGVYGGAVGYFSYDGSMDTCITIRTIVLQGETAHVQAGAGIVADSDPAAEYEESVNKARALAIAIDRAEQGLI